jgi:hypothetical protein
MAVDTACSSSLTSIHILHQLCAQSSCTHGVVASGKCVFAAIPRSLCPATNSKRIAYSFVDSGPFDHHNADIRKYARTGWALQNARRRR